MARERERGQRTQNVPCCTLQPPVVVSVAISASQSRTTDHHLSMRIQPLLTLLHLATVFCFENITQSQDQLDRDPPDLDTENSDDDKE